MINTKQKYKVIANNTYQYSKNEFLFEQKKDAEDCFQSYSENGNIQEVALLEYDQFSGWMIKNTHQKQLLID